MKIEETCKVKLEDSDDDGLGWFSFSKLNSLIWLLLNCLKGHLKEHSTFLKIGSFSNSPRVKQLSFTVF